jgi:hypothetical protein
MRLRLAVNEVARNLIDTICNESAGLPVAPAGRRGTVSVAEALAEVGDAVEAGGIGALGNRSRALYAKSADERRGCLLGCAPEQRVCFSRSRF